MFFFGTRNDEGERILEYSDSVGIMVCNTFFKKKDYMLISYHWDHGRSVLVAVLLR